MVNMVKSMVALAALAALLFFAVPAQALDGYYSVNHLMTVPLDQAESYIIGAVDGVLLFLDRSFSATLYCPNGAAAPNSTDLMWFVADTIIGQVPQAQWKLYAASWYVVEGLFGMGCTIVQQ